jgi:DNA-binding SARP family transcriptional activator
MDYDPNALLTRRYHRLFSAKHTRYARHMNFGLLGPVTISGDEGPIKLEGPRVRALLAYLLLHANKPVSTAELLEALWGDEYPRSGATAVQNAVVRLRRVLGERVLTAGAGYLVRVEPGELDLERFRDLVLRAKSSPPAEAMELLRDALTLWNGEPLGGTGSAAFADRAAASLEDERVAAVAAQVDAELALGRHAELVPMLSTLIAEQPLDERFRAQLIIALYRSGRQAAALDVYRETRRLLMDELGLEPGPVLRDLERAVLTQDPALDPPPPSQPVAEVAAAPLPPFVEDEPRRSPKRSLVRVAAIVPLGVAGAALAVALSRHEPVSLANPTTIVKLTTRPAGQRQPVTSVPRRVSTGQVRLPTRTTAVESDRATTSVTPARNPPATGATTMPVGTATVGKESATPATTPQTRPAKTSTTTTTATTAAKPTTTAKPKPTTTAHPATQARLVYWIADDFSEPGIDDARWRLAGHGTGVSVSEENGRLAFSVGEDVMLDPPYGVDQHYGTKCLLVGDFDATVDYELVEWPAGDGVSVTFGVYLPPPNESFVAIERRGASTAGGSESYGASGGGFAQTADTTGSFRLRRTGASVRMSYRRRGAWVSLGTVPAGGPVNLVLSVTTNEPQFGHKPASAAFRSFQAFADAVKCDGAPLPPRRSHT